MRNSEIIIIGGGLAGLTAGIHLSKKGVSVVIIEKNDYPKHKVCGEYLSNEVLPYFEWLDLNLSSLNPVNINEIQLSTKKGSAIKTKLPLGGLGISRYELDFYLYKKALSNGCKILIEEVEKIINDVLVERKKQVRKIKLITSRECKICKIEKPLIELVISHDLGPDRPPRFKKLCLECQKSMSKRYYKEKKPQILEGIKKKADNEKKKFNVQVKFNSIEELENKMNLIKNNIENNLIEEIKQRKPRTKKNNGGGQSPATICASSI